MGWIRERIKAEKRKHHDVPFGQAKRDLDWARIAEGKIAMQIMEFASANNTVPLTDLKNIQCECGHSLFAHRSPDIEKREAEECSNKFCTCRGYKKVADSKLVLATTDGGWVNVLKLREFLRREL